MIRAAAMVATAATPALADFGAIAYSAETGGYGIGWKVAARGEAEHMAVDACAAYGRGCAVAASFEDACGALAVGRAYTIRATATGPRLSDAEARALSACRRLNDAGCEIEVSFCSNR
jgi:Tfp pilus tip-associated adhesin PilY1